MTCKSSNVIYCVTCKKCNGQYIGETEQELHCRSSSHLSEIRHNRPGLPYVSHFRNCGIEFYSITGVEKIRDNDFRIRKQREIFYKKLFKVSIKQISPELKNFVSKLFNMVNSVFFIFQRQEKDENKASKLVTQPIVTPRLSHMLCTLSVWMGKTI